MPPTAPAGPIRFRVRIDGQPPGTAHGADVDERGDGTVTDPRLYQLIRQPGAVAERTFEITLLDPGIQAYAFTFGSTSRPDRGRTAFEDTPPRLRMASSRLSRWA